MLCKKFISSSALCALLICGSAHADERVPLLPHDISSTVPLIQSLEERRSSREMIDADLTASELSTLLWATAGVNRDDGKFTYPTASDRRDMTLYVFTRYGAYRYDAEAHALELIVDGDLRAATGTQPFARSASVSLVFVQDTTKWTDVPAELVPVIGTSHASSMAQNAYLYAASRGLACVTRMSFDADRIARILKLPASSRVVLTQSAGRSGGNEVAHRTNELGGITPDQALDYLALTDRAIIVDVRPARLRSKTFRGSIPIAASDIGQDAADDLIRSLPSDRPILIHCGNGVSAKRVYDRTLTLRSDLLELVFIDGAPKFEERTVRIKMR